MTGKTTEAATLAAIEAGRGVQIWAAEAALGQALQATLKQRYSVTLRAELPTADQGGEGAVLLLAPSPAEALCQALQGDADPAAARAKVQQDTTALLTLQRRHRRRVVLLDQSVARHSPAALLTFCGGKSGLDRLQAAAGDAPNAVMMVLAQVRLQADPLLMRLAGEFAAAATLLPGWELDGRDPDTALVTFLQEQEGLEELALLRDQQRSMYEQLEGLYGEKQQLEQRLEQARGGLDSFQAQAEALTGEAEALEREVSVLKGRLATKGEVLHTAGVRIEELEQIIDHQTRDAAELKTALQKFRNSRSYRMTAPLRRLRRVLRGRG